MRTVCLASGSKGNCIYIESSQAKILIDEGLSLSTVVQKLKKIGIDPEKIDAILITHEHSDHISGVGAFARKFKTKIFVPSLTQNFINSYLGKISQDQVVFFSSSDFFIKDITVSSFSLSHDSRFCVGYSLYFDNKKVSIATDLGYVSKEVLFSLSGSDVLFFESNHDENLLKQNPKYTAKLKKRILSNVGHLSNVACGEAISQLVGSGVKQVVLSHLSEENNNPNLAYETVRKILFQNGIVEGTNVCVDVAFQNEIGTIFNF